MKADTLRRAKDIIEKQGFHQRGFWSFKWASEHELLNEESVVAEPQQYDGPVCMMGAYALAAEEDQVFAEEDYEWFTQSFEEDAELQKLFECSKAIYDEHGSKAFELGVDETDVQTMYRLNDNIGKEAVMKAFDCAINKVESEE
jgi:hypothetical protein